LTLRWFVRDLDIRASLIANTVHEPIEELLRAGNRNRVEQFFTRITQDERLFAIGFWLGQRRLRLIAGDLRMLIRDLEADHRSRDPEQLAWTPETLRAIVRDDLRGHQVIVVSNREPYIHVRRDQQIDVWRPASGVVTALEPIMRACSGTWLAHGGGSADRDVVDDPGGPPGCDDHLLLAHSLAQSGNVCHLPVAR